MHCDRDDSNINEVTGLMTLCTHSNLEVMYEKDDLRVLHKRVQNCFIPKRGGVKK